MNVENFYHPKTAIFGQIWSKIHIFLKKITLKDRRFYVIKYENTYNFTLEMLYAYF